MEKIAIISDIHGCTITLNKVLKDIKERGINRIFCLGDLVAKGTEPKEAIDLVRRNCEVVIKGNCDDVISNYPETEEHLWNKEKIGEENVEYLNSLPLSYDFYMSGLKIRLIHATSDSLYNSINYYDINESILNKIEKLFENSKEFENEGEKNPDIVIFGHIHSPFVYRLKDKTAINSSSVSNACDIIEKNGKKYMYTSYLIVEGEYEKKEQSTISFKYVKLPYDYKKEIEELEKSDMPNKEMAIEEIKTGIYVKR